LVFLVWKYTIWQPCLQWHRTVESQPIFLVSTCLKNCREIRIIASKQTFNIQSVFSVCFLEQWNTERKKGEAEKMEFFC
jgi:hypothetical protein